MTFSDLASIGAGAGGDAGATSIGAALSGPGAVGDGAVDRAEADGDTFAALLNLLVVPQPLVPVVPMPLADTWVAVAAEMTFADIVAASGVDALPAAAGHGWVAGPLGWEAGVAGGFAMQDPHYAYAAVEDADRFAGIASMPAVPVPVVPDPMAGVTGQDEQAAPAMAALEPVRVDVPAADTARMASMLTALNESPSPLPPGQPPTPRLDGVTEAPVPPVENTVDQATDQLMMQARAARVAVGPANQTARSVPADATTDASAAAEAVQAERPAVPAAPAAAVMTTPAPRPERTIRPPAGAEDVVADAAPVAASSEPSAQVSVTVQGGGSGRPFDGDDAPGQSAGAPVADVRAAAPAAGVPFAEMMSMAAPRGPEAAPTEPLRGEPAEIPDLTPQIVRSVRMQMVGDVGHARVRLRPEHLGELIVDVRVEQGDVVASVRSDVPEVREWIQARSEELRSALGAHGLELVHVAVKEREQSKGKGQGSEGKDRSKDRKGKGTERRVFELAA